MAIPAHPLPTPSGVVADACAELAGLTEKLWAAQPDEELVETIQELQRLLGLLTAIQAPVLAELDTRDTARHKLGWASTADWFTHLAGLRRGQGKPSRPRPPAHRRPIRDPGCPA